MPIYLDGKEYENETALEAAYNPAVPESLKRVYINTAESTSGTGETSKTGEGAPIVLAAMKPAPAYRARKSFNFGDGGMVANPENGNWERLTRDHNEFALPYDTNILSNPREVSFKTPLGSTEKPADALIAEPGTPLAPDTNASPEPSYSNGIKGQWQGDTFYPTPDYAGPPEGHSVMKGVGKFIEKTAKNIATIPQRAIENSQYSLDTGNYDPSVPIEAAGIAVLGPAPLAKKLADGTLGSFAGVTSKTVDKERLKLAQTAKEQGFTTDEIYKSTGFFQGKDKRWRYEIDDSTSTWKPPQTGVGGPLWMFLDHPELFKAYPDIKNVHVRNDPYHPTSGAQWDGKTIILGEKASQDKSVLMHEIQHAIQDLESFAKGGQSGKAGKDYKLRYEEDINKLRPTFLNLQKLDREGAALSQADQAKLDYLRHIFKKYSDYSRAGDMQARENYLLLAGETESRNVQTRTEMTQGERMRTPPSQTQDVIDQHQIETIIPIATNPYLKPGQVIDARSVDRSRSMAEPPKITSEFDIEREALRLEDYLRGSRAHARTSGYKGMENDVDMKTLLNHSDPNAVWFSVNTWEGRSPAILGMEPKKAETLVAQMKQLEEKLTGEYSADVFNNRGKFNAKREAMRQQYDDLRQKAGLDKVGEGFNDPAWGWAALGEKRSPLASGDVKRLLELSKKDSDFSLTTRSSIEVARDALKNISNQDN